MDDLDIKSEISEPSGEEDNSPSDEFGQEAYKTSCRIVKTTPAEIILKSLPTKTLSLKHRCIGPIGAKALAAALVNNKTVETLDLEENALEGEGATYICEMLTVNKTITTVKLARNMLGSVGALALANLILTNNSIVNLDVSDNNFKDYDAQALSNAIEKNEKIVNLNLSHNSFSQVSAQLFSQAFGSNNSIENLDISWNQFSKKDAGAICLGLKVSFKKIGQKNYCLTSINMSWNGIGLEGSSSLCDALRGNKYLKELNISNNRINWEGALFISKGLKENDTLEVLMIGGNPLTMTGVLDLLDSVDNEQSAVNTMDFTDVPVNRKIMYIIESLQKHRQLAVRHGPLVECDDLFGRRMVLRCDPLKLLIQFLADKSIKPYELFKEFDPEKHYKVPREHFLRVLKAAKVPLDEYDYEKLLLRFDSSGKEGKINYQRLIKGVKDQIKQNKAEEKIKANGMKKLDRNLETNEDENLDENFLEQSINNGESPDSSRSTPSLPENTLFANLSSNDTGNLNQAKHLKNILLGKNKVLNSNESLPSTERSVGSEASLKNVNVTGAVNNRLVKKVQMKSQKNDNKISTLYE